MFVLNVVCFFFTKAASIDFRPTSGVRLIPYTKLGGGFRSNEVCQYGQLNQSHHKIFGGSSLERASSLRAQ